MSSGGHDDDFIARALVEASLAGKDSVAAGKLGVSTRTLKRWRQRAATDANLARLVREKKAIADGDWAVNLAPAIRAGIDFLGGAMKVLDARDPEAVKAAGVVLKLLTETAMSRRILDARLSQQAGQPGATDRAGGEPVESEGEGEEPPAH